MLTVVVRRRFATVLALGPILSLFILTSTAEAQPLAPGTSSSTSGTQPSTAPAAGGSWALIGGYEWDTHDTGYAFFGPAYTHPIKPGLAWTASVFPNFLYYKFSSPAGTTKVHSPGVSSMLGLRFGDKNFFKIGAGPEVKWRKTEFQPISGAVVEKTDTRVGLSTGAEMYVNPSARSNVHALVNYNTADKYTWGRVGVKGQVNNLDWTGKNTTFLGVEGIGQGNKDIKSVLFGGFVEVVHVPADLSVAFKVGYKRSTFPAAPDKTGPYFAVTFYKRLK